MTKDYQIERDRMSLRALDVINAVGSDRAVQIFLGAIDALTVAVFTVNGHGGRGSIGLVIDNTVSQPDFKGAA